MNVNKLNTQASNVKQLSEKSQEQGRSYFSSHLLPMLVLLLLLTADTIVFFHLFIN